MLGMLSSGSPTTLHSCPQHPRKGLSCQVARQGRTLSASLRKWQRPKGFDHHLPGCGPVPLYCSPRIRPLVTQYRNSAEIYGFRASRLKKPLYSTCKQRESCTSTTTPTCRRRSGLPSMQLLPLRDYHRALSRCAAEMSSGMMACCMS